MDSPNPVNEKTYPISPKWLLRPAATKAVMLVLFLIILIISGDPNLFAYVLVILLGTSIIIQYLSVRMFRYSLGSEYITINQGVLNKQQKHFAYGVIQNVFVEQDLFDRILGIASLTIENAAVGAGGNASSAAYYNKKVKSNLVGIYGNRVRIPGLKKEHAAKLRNYILEKIKENPIDDMQSGL